MSKPSHKVTRLHILASLIVFAVAFVVAWAASLWVLWEYIYGDTMGGRWINLAWPPAFYAACISVGLFWLRVPLGHRLRPRVYCAGLIGWIVASGLWVVIGGNLAGMPPFWKPPLVDERLRPSSTSRLQIVPRLNFRYAQSP